MYQSRTESKTGIALSSSKNLLNIVIFQLAWWALAISLAQKLHSLAYSVIAVGVLLHIFYISRPGERRLWVSAAAAGFLMDLVFAGLGWIEFYQTSQLIFVGWAWLLGIWLLFAATLSHSLNWLLQKPILAAVLGAIFGPLTYYLAGRQFHLLQFQGDLWVTIAVYAICWGIYLYVIAKIYTRQPQSGGRS